jgi:hypothetical protein
MPSKILPVITSYLRGNDYPVFPSTFSSLMGLWHHFSYLAIPLDSPIFSSYLVHLLKAGAREAPLSKNEWDTLHTLYLGSISDALKKKIPIFNGYTSIGALSNHINSCYVDRMMLQIAWPTAPEWSFDGIIGDYAIVEPADIANGDLIEYSGVIGKRPAKNYPIYLYVESTKQYSDIVVGTTGGYFAFNQDKAWVTASKAEGVSDVTVGTQKVHITLLRKPK